LVSLPSRAVQANEGTKFFGDTMRLGSDTKVSEIYYKGALDEQQHVTVGQRTAVGDQYFPLFPHEPLPKLAEPAADTVGASGTVMVQKNKTLCLQPGTYGVRAGKAGRYAEAGG
jgi:hypothetical protein